MKSGVDKMAKAVCVKIGKIQSNLVDNALELYEQKKYREFWSAIESIDLFLSVSEGLGCSKPKRKK